MKEESTVSSNPVPAHRTKSHIVCSRTFLSSMRLLFDLPQPLDQLVFLTLYSLLLFLRKLPFFLLVLQLCSIKTAENNHHAHPAGHLVLRVKIWYFTGFCTPQWPLSWLWVYFYSPYISGHWHGSFTTKFHVNLHAHLYKITVYSFISEQLVTYGPCDNIVTVHDVWDI